MLRSNSIEMPTVPIHVDAVDNWATRCLIAHRLEWGVEGHGTATVGDLGQQMVHAVKALVNFGRGTATCVFVETTLDAGGDALHGVATKGWHLAEEQYVNSALNEEFY